MRGRSNDLQRRASALLARLLEYARRDVREIVWPRPMDDPPWYKAQRSRKLTLEEHREIWVKALGMWRESWANVFRRQEEAPSTSASEEARGRPDGNGEASTSANEVEDRSLDDEGRLLADEAKRAVRAGKAGFKPLVTYLYETRGRAYRDGVREFIKAYREGFKEVQTEYEDEKQTISSKAASMISRVENVLEKAEKTEVEEDSTGTKRTP